MFPWEQPFDYLLNIHAPDIIASHHSTADYSANEIAEEGIRPDYYASEVELDVPPEESILGRLKSALEGGISTVRPDLPDFPSVALQILEDVHADKLVDPILDEKEIAPLFSTSSAIAESLAKSIFKAARHPDVHFKTPAPQAIYSQGGDQNVRITSPGINSAYSIEYKRPGVLLHHRDGLAKFTMLDATARSSNHEAMAVKVSGL